MAGVSLNAIIGDNGIINQALDANIELRCSELQEYIQQFYVENYDHFSESQSKIAGLKSDSKSSGWIYQGKMGYILDNSGNVHYYLDCEKLPEEAKKIIGKIDKKTYIQYVEGDGVYGITEDLEIYYSVKDSDGNNKYYGKKNLVFAKEDGSEEIFDSESVYSKIVTGTGENGSVTRADLRNVNELSLNENSGIKDFNEFYNFVDLKILRLNNIEIVSLEGLEYSINIDTIFLTNCKIEDYSSLAELSKLKYLFLYNMGDKEVEKLCNSQTGIGGKDIPSLNFFGIYGYINFHYLYSYKDRSSFRNIHNSFSNVSYLSNLSQKTKNSITHLFLNNNMITNIDNLYEFGNVEILRLEENYINSLQGIYNKSSKKGMTKLKYLFANDNNLGYSLEGDDLNPEVDSLASFSSSKKISEDNYEFTKVLEQIDTVDLSSNINLKFIDYLIACETIKYLYLENCKGLSMISLKRSSSVIDGCINYRIDEDANFYLASVSDGITKLDFTKTDKASNEVTGRKMTEKEFKELLNGKTKLSWLKLNSLELTDDYGINLSREEFNKSVNDVLSKLTNLHYLGLKDLFNLTSVDFVNNCKSLVELDLRGTSCIDLSLLSDNMHSGRVLWIDNVNTDLNNITSLFDNFTRRISWRDSLYGVDVCGVLICNQDLANNVNGLSIKNFFLQCDDEVFENLTFDLRNCSNLLNGDICFLAKSSFYLPLNLERLGKVEERFIEGAVVSSWANIINIDELKNVKECKFILHGSGDISYFSKFPNLTKLDIYEIGARINGNLNSIQELRNLKELYIYSYSGRENDFSVENDFLTGLGNFTNLTTLYLSYNRKITDLPNDISNLTSLTSLTLNNTNIKCLEFIKNLPNLNSLNLENINISETGFFKNIDGSSGTCDNMEVIKNLFNKNLKNIYLLGTNISDFSKIEKLGWVDKSGF